MKNSRKLTQRIDLKQIKSDSRQQRNQNINKKQISQIHSISYQNHSIHMNGQSCQNQQENNNMSKDKDKSIKGSIVKQNIKQRKQLVVQVDISKNNSNHSNMNSNNNNNNHSNSNNNHSNNNNNNITQNNIINNDQQQQKIQQLNNNFSQLSLSLSQIKNQYKQLHLSQKYILNNNKNSQNSNINNNNTSNIKNSSVIRHSKLDDPKIRQFIQKKQQQSKILQNRRLVQIQKIIQKRQKQYEQQVKLKQQSKKDKIQQIKKYSFIKNYKKSDINNIGNINNSNDSNNNNSNDSNNNIDNINSINNNSNRNKINIHNLTSKKPSAQILDKYTKSIPLFQINQKVSLQSKQTQIQQIKQYLKQHREQYQQKTQKYLNLQSIQQHKKWHNQIKEKFQKQKIDEKNKIYNEIEQNNQKLKNVYRGRFNQYIQEEIRNREEGREMPYRLRENVKNYEKYVKQHYYQSIKNNSNNRYKNNNNNIRTKSSSLQLSHLNNNIQQEQRKHNLSQVSYRQIKRFKYLQGVSFGQITQQQPQAKSYNQQRKLGKSYLQYMKSLPKKQLQQQHIQIAINKHKPNPLKHQHQKNSIININSQPTRAEINMILEQLKNNDKKIKQIQLRKKHNSSQNNTTFNKAINDQLLINVERKLNLLHQLETNNINNNHVILK